MRPNLGSLKRENYFHIAMDLIRQGRITPMDAGILALFYRVDVEEFKLKLLRIAGIA